MSSYRCAAAVIGSVFGFGFILGCNGYLPGEAAESVSQPSRGECTTKLTTVLIDQKGGVLKVPEDNPLFGARLQIPAGALTEPAWVTLSTGSDLTMQDAGLSQTLCVSIVDRSEEGRPVTLAKAAALILPYDAARIGHITTDRSRHLVIGEKTADAKPPLPMPGLTVVDEQHRLLAGEMHHPGRYLAITRGAGALAENPNLDVLFVVDNSGSMSPKQPAIAKHFGGFFKQVTRYSEPTFENCINYHIGITSTDVGRDAAGKGDDGQLQFQTCLQRAASLGSAKAQAVCQMYCSPGTKGLPPGDKFIARSTTLLTTTTPEDQERQFKCMAILGDAGSGEESPLESIHRTLERQRSMTPDKVNGEKFFREQGLTAMVILTDEDDCSIRDSKRSEFYTPTGACSSGDPGQPSCYNDTNARCRGVSLKCNSGDLLNASGKKNGCTSRPDFPMGSSILNPAKYYAEDLRTFITSSGGNNLGRTGKFGTLYLYGAWPLADADKDFETKIAFTLDVANPPPSNTLGKNAFCYDAMSLMTSEPILGHPQVRLNEFAREVNPAPTPMGSLPQITAASICKEAEREHLLDQLADAITKSPHPMACMKSLAP